MRNRRRESEITFNVRTLGRTIADGRGQEDGSLSLSLRGIVMYDVGVVGRDTVYLPTYLHEIRDFAPLIRDPFLSFERSMRYVDNRIIEKGGREILRVSSRGGTRNQSSSRRLAPKIVPHCEYNGGA